MTIRSPARPTTTASGRITRNSSGTNHQAAGGSGADGEQRPEQDDDSHLADALQPLVEPEQLRGQVRGAADGVGCDHGRVLARRGDGLEDGLVRFVGLLGRRPFDPADGERSREDREERVACAAAARPRRRGRSARGTGTRRGRRPRGVCAAGTGRPGRPAVPSSAPTPSPPATAHTTSSAIHRDPAVAELVEPQQPEAEHDQRERAPVVEARPRRSARTAARRDRSGARPARPRRGRVGRREDRAEDHGRADGQPEQHAFRRGRRARRSRASTPSRGEPDGASGGP